MEIETTMSMNQNLLSVLIDTKEIKEDFRFRMLQTNCVENLLPVQRYYEDHQARYLYDTTDKIAFSSHSLQQRLSEEDIRLFMEAVFKSLIRGKDYYLEEDSYLLDPDYIYYSKQEKTYYFCYCPDYARPIRETIVDIVSYLMGKVDYEDLEAVKLVYQLYQQVREESFSAKKLLEYLKKSSAHKNSRQEKRSIHTSTLQLQQQISIESASEFTASIREETMLQNPPVLEQVKEASLQGAFQEEQPPWVQPDLKKENTSQGKRRFLEEKASTEEEMALKKGTLIFILAAIGLLLLFYLGFASGLFYTDVGRQLNIKKLIVFIGIALLVLGYIAWRMFKEPQIENANQPEINFRTKVESIPEEYRLIPCDGQRGAPILLNRFPFSIGKDTSRVNGAIEDPKISRIHAVLTMEGGRLYLNDTNSLNGTFVNHKRLCPETITPLQPGDFVGFANHIYQLTV